MKPRKEIFQNVSSALGDLIIHKQVRYIGLQKGQLNNLAQSRPVPLPCVLIGIAAIDYQLMPANRAEGQAIITLDIAFENYHEQFSGSHDNEQSLEMLDLLDEIVRLMSYVRGENFTDLHLARERHLPYSIPGIQLHQLEFSCKTYHLLKNKVYVSITGGA